MAATIGGALVKGRSAASAGTANPTVAIATSEIVFIFVSWFFQSIAQPCIDSVNSLLRVGEARIAAIACEAHQQSRKAPGQRKSTCQFAVHSKRQHKRWN